MVVGLVIFFVSLTLVAYTYVVYPLLVFGLAHLYPERRTRGPVAPTTVSIIIAARNEERDIRQKLENTLRIDYPKEKLEIVVISDGSTDRTNEIVSEFSAQNVRLIRQEPRMGKTAAQNLGVSSSAGEILLFSDATTAYRPNVLAAILPNFADDAVGCVAGRLVYEDPTNSSVGKGALRYWGYESFLKENESRACSLIGVSGCLYAVRRSAYVPMYPEACSDFLIASILYRQGLRTVYEPDAVAVEVTNVDRRQEFAMRTRVITQTLGDLWKNRGMMNPFRYGFFAVELVSHKLLRYLLPIFLSGLLLSSAYLATASQIFQVVLVFQLLFYGFALIGYLLDSSKLRVLIFSLPFYFVLTNVASLNGIFKFIQGKRFAVWEPGRHC